METLTFDDWALLIIATGDVAMVFGGLVGWVIFGTFKGDDE